jgi:3-methylfumaryl-CoA hydratase
MTEWNDWIGREERREDRVDPAQVARWCATLDRQEDAAGLAPQGLHWCLCLPDAMTAELGTDGHPRRDTSPDSFLPPVPLPRRMWASSAVTFMRALRVGDSVTRQSRIKSITPKQGGTGLLVFLEIEHDTLADGEVAVREVQNIVYRDAAPAGAPPSPPLPGPGQFDPAPWSVVRSITPSEPLLFRFSALTFNSHRIHYDLPYAIGEEGYRGLVVHGPLTATLLLDLARRELGEQALATFAFRGVTPAVCGEVLHLAMRPVETGFQLGAFAGDGRHVMSATATTA